MNCPNCGAATKAKKRGTSLSFACDGCGYKWSEHTEGRWVWVPWASEVGA